jgi:hypothetical protein
MDARPSGPWLNLRVRASCIALLVGLIAFLSWQAYGSWLFRVASHVG